MPRRALGLPGPIHERLVFLDALHHHPLNSQRVNFLILSLNLHSSWEWLLNPLWVFSYNCSIMFLSPAKEKAWYRPGLCFFPALSSGSLAQPWVPL